MDVESIEHRLSQHCKWVEVKHESWGINEYETTKGNRVKFTASPPEGQAPLDFAPFQYFYKESVPRFPKEFWSEVLAYHIGTVVGVPVSPCFPAIYTGSPEKSIRFGSLAHFLIDASQSESIFHAGDLFTEFFDGYDRKQGLDHSVSLVMKLFIILDHFLHPLVSFDIFATQLLFDAIIGNSDRHQDNWGFKAARQHSSTISLELLPAFDNGTSLGRELDDEKIQNYLANQAALNAYIERGTHHIKWGPNGEIRKVRHLDLINSILNLDKWDRSVFAKILDTDFDQLERSIRRVCLLSRQPFAPEDVQISLPREEFLVKLANLRIKRLQKLLDSP